MPDKGQVHVWCASLLAPAAQTTQLARFLAPEEAERAQRFHFGDDRDQYAVRRAILRLLLSRYLTLPPQDVPVQYGPHGKPTLAAPAPGALQFSVSSNQGLALYAFSWQQRVGVDVERVRGDPLDAAVARRLFSPAEFRAMQGLSEPARSRLFFEWWTAKEAVAKATGDGLSQPFAWSCLPTSEGAAPGCGGFPTWTVRTLTPAASYVASVAVEGTDGRLTCWRWPE
jgi:4'-phosphopantetheinyl transferase